MELFQGLYQSRYTQELRNVREWLPQPTTRFVSNGFQLKLKLKVQGYIANETSLLTHFLWETDSHSEFTQCPSIAFGMLPEDERALKPELDQYLVELIPLLIGEVARAGYDNIYKTTMQGAYQYYQANTVGSQSRPQDLPAPRKHVFLALKIWAAQCVFFKHPWRLELQSESLEPVSSFEMTVVTQEQSPFAGLTPLPHLLHWQMASMMERRIAELEQQFLTELQSLTQRKQPNEWFGMYLSMFVFFSSLEEDTWGLKTWGGKVIETPVSSQINLDSSIIHTEPV